MKVHSFPYRLLDFIIVSEETSEDVLKKSIINTDPVIIHDKSGSKSPAKTIVLLTGESILKIPIIIADKPNQNFTILLENMDINPGKTIWGLTSVLSESLSLLSLFSGPRKKYNPAIILQTIDNK